MNGITLDAGALIALDRNERRLVALLRVAVDANVPITVPAAVVGQAWRNGAKQVRLARLLGSKQVTVEPLDDLRARAAGQFCGVSGTKDVIDASVVVGAKARRDRILTSDPDDLRLLDPNIELTAI